ncbi:hypothetical protein STEG23_016067, partial [Scotinomys teguina]
PSIKKQLQNPGQLPPLHSTGRSIAYAVLELHKVFMPPAQSPKLRTRSCF